MIFYRLIETGRSPVSRYQWKCILIDRRILRSKKVKRLPHNGSGSQFSGYFWPHVLYDDCFLFPDFAFVFIKALWRPFSFSRLHFRLHKRSMATVFFSSLVFSSSWALHDDHFLFLSCTFVVMNAPWRLFSFPLLHFRRHERSLATILLPRLHFRHHEPSIAIVLIPLVAMSSSENLASN